MPTHHAVNCGFQYLLVFRHERDLGVIYQCDIMLSHRLGEMLRGPSNLGMSFMLS